MTTWVLQRARRGVLLGVVASVPVFCLPLVTQDPYGIPKVTMVLAGVGVAGLLRCLDLRPLSVAAGRLLVPAACVSAPLLLGWLGSSYQTLGVMGVYGRYAGLLPYLALIILAVLVADAFAGRSRALELAAVVGAGVVGWFTVIQAAGLDPSVGRQILDYPYSTIGNSNFLGGFLALSLPLGLSVWARSDRTRFVGLLGTIGIALGIILAFSQGGWAASIAAIGVFTGARAAHRSRRWLFLGAAAALVITSLSVGAVLWSLRAPNGPLSSETVRVRGLFWMAAVEMGVESPIVGHGPAAFSVEGPHHRPAEDALIQGAVAADDPHNVLLSMFVSGGVLAVGGFLLVMLWVWRTALSLPLEGPAAGFVASVAAYVVQAAVSVDQFILSFGLWIAVAGLAAAAGDRPVDPAGRGEG
ncbi:MAG: O-antigen ligase family protein, partial [Actinomycetota bacterium]